MYIKTKSITKSERRQKHLWDETQVELGMLGFFSYYMYIYIHIYNYIFPLRRQETIPFILYFCEITY